VSRGIQIAIAVTLVLGGRARADTQAHVGHIALADGGVTLCRNLFDIVVDGGKIETVDQPTADCWHVDFASGAVAAAPIPARAEQSWPKEPPPGATMVSGGVRVCSADDPTACKTIALRDAGSYELVATNAARTIVAVQKSPPREGKANIVTLEVATGRRLATLTAYGDILQLLGDSLFVQASCAAPCGGTLYNARTGKRIARVSADIASANDDNNNHVAGNIWELKETARETGAPGLLLEDVTTGKRIKRIALDALVRVEDAEPQFQVFPAPGGLLVVEYQTSHPAFAGDCALVDAKGNVVRRFAAPDWPRP